VGQLSDQISEKKKGKTTNLRARIALKEKEKKTIKVYAVIDRV
jgi:hypothetical protein